MNTYINIDIRRPLWRVRIDGSFILFFPILRMPKQPYTLTTPDSPNSACIRLRDCQILWILKFSERLFEPDYLYRGQSGRSKFI